MLSCREMTEVVTDYFEGRMGWRDRWMFRWHTLMCPACFRYVRQVRATIRTLGKMPAEPVPDDVCQSLKSAFKDWHKGQSEEVAIEIKSSDCDESNHGE